MTAPGYNAVTDGELAPGQPLTSGLAFRLRDNPLAITQRGANAPWLNGIGAVQIFKALFSENVFTWTVPAGVYRAEFTIIGAGANVEGTQAGGNTSVSGVGTANGGAYNNAAPDDSLCADNGGKGLVVVAGAERRFKGIGGRIEVFVVNTTPGATHTVTCGLGGGRVLGSGATGGSGGNGLVIIRY
jgi:hypothetical protein